jgi:Insertion element 4 transposase N-terminal
MITWKATGGRCRRAFAARPCRDSQNAHIVDPAASDLGVLAGAAEDLVSACQPDREKAGLRVEPLPAGARGVPDYERASREHLPVDRGRQKVANPGAVKTPKAMTGRMPAVADVLANWKCSVPETDGPAADDAPAGTASHKAPRRSWHVPTKAALFKARARLGPEPLKALFGAAAASLAAADTQGA